MKGFADIERAFSRIDADLQERLRDETVLELDEDADRTGRIIELNDNAYFFMLFARFDHLVAELALARAEAGRRATNLEDRRVWSVLDIRKMDFLRRLALLTDKGSPDYATVKELYEDRNAVAHGKLAETKPNVPIIATILSGILSRLEGTP